MAADSVAKHRQTDSKALIHHRVEAPLGVDEAHTGQGVDDGPQAVDPFLVRLEAARTIAVHAREKIAGTLKLELAQFDELAAFSQFASDLDAATQQQLARGKRLREILKQPQFSPLILAEQVAVVYAGVKGLIDEVPVESVVQFCRELREYLKTNKPEFITKIQTEKVLSEDAEAMLKAAINEVKSSMLAAA